MVSNPNKTTQLKLNLLDAIGTSLDLQSNCIEFQETLLQQLNLQFSAIWIFNHHLRTKVAHGLSMISAIPKRSNQLSKLNENHEIFNELKQSKYLIVEFSDPEFQIIRHHADVVNGTYFLFKLGKVGLIQLYSQSGFISTDEIAVLQIIFNKLSISLYGTIAFQKLNQEQAAKRKAQLALEITEQKYRFIVEGLSEGIIITDLLGRIVFVNEKMMSLSGYSNDELLGKNAVSIFIPDGNTYKATKRIIATNDDDSESYLIEHRHKSGKIWVASVRESPFRSAANQVIGKLGLIMDVTESKRAEAELMAAKHVAVKAQQAEQQFLANMSHEIRTPMNAVVGITDLLNETPLNNEQKDFVDILKFSADSLMGVINSIIDLSKISSGNLEFESKPINLLRLLHGLKKTYQLKLQKRPVDVQLIIDEKIQHPIIGDPTRLNQVLNNLMSNAAKFTSKGFIKLRAKLINQTASTYLILFEVTDSGIGIELDKIEMIFENFKQADVTITRKYGGTGLGLAIVKQIVELQNGEIEVVSEKGKGATFKVKLEFPYSAELSELEIVPPKIYDISLRESRFLIVEDNLMNQKIITKLLEIWGGNYDIARNGVEAIEKTKSQKYDLIFMDINMPEMDGYEATKEIRNDVNNINTSTTIIALTAAALSNEKNKALNVGMNDFISKPFNSKALRSLIGFWLNSEDDNQPSYKEANVPKTKVEGIPIDKIPQIDLSKLMDMANGDMTFVLEMVKIFINQIPESIVGLQVGLQEKNWRVVENLAHKIKSNFIMVGLNQLHEDALEIECIIKSNKVDESKIALLVGRLVARSDIAIPLLKEEMKKLKK